MGEQQDILDMVIVGAGLSGIGMAYYLGREHPTRRYQILEARDDSGGTWDLFRYPGIRSDSDLYTFGYAFKPWTEEKSIADGASILKYLRQSAAEFGIEQNIQYQSRVMACDFDTRTGLWRVEIEHSKTLERSTKLCRWLFCAAGYYRFDQGYRPDINGLERFQGPVVHPQFWPQDLDYQDKKIVVIGSGATAVTLVPSLAQTAAHVTMLQRTPTYVVTQPAKDRIAHALRRWLPEDLAHRLIRQKNIRLSRLFWRFCKRWPKAAKNLITKGIAKQLPEDFAVATHFNPPYNPWDQRLCLVPNGDLFKSLKSGKASIVTGQIQTVTEHSVTLNDGQELPADILITATGLVLQSFGGVKLSIDGEAVALENCVAFKGMMLSGIPNLAFAIGYTNASWTLKVGLVCEHLCRLLKHMDQAGFAVVSAELADPNMPTRPLLDFGAGYVTRSLAQLPKQGLHAPWLMPMDYLKDVHVLRKGPVTDPHLTFRRLDKDA